MVEELLDNLKLAKNEDDIRFLVELIKSQCNEKEIENIRKHLVPDGSIIGYQRGNVWSWSLDYEKGVFYAFENDNDVRHNYIYL